MPCRWRCARVTASGHGWSCSSHRRLPRGGGLDAYWLRRIDRDKKTHKPIYDARARRRVFENCFRYGTDPACVKGLNGTMLLEEVHAAPELRIAKQFFESKLWDLLCQSAPQTADVDACMTGQRAQSGRGSLTRLDHAVEGVIAHAWPAKVHRNAFLESVGTVDGLLVLGCHRARAGDSERAHIARRAAALGFAFRRFVDRWRIPERLSDALAHLIQTRLIDGRARHPMAQELAALGFPIRQRKAAELVSPPQERAGAMPSHARLDAGFVATCIRLAVASAHPVIPTTSQVASPTTMRHARSSLRSVLGWPSGGSIPGYRPTPSLRMLAMQWVLLHRHRCPDYSVLPPWAVSVPWDWQRRPKNRKGWAAIAHGQAA